MAKIKVAAVRKNNCLLPRLIDDGASRIVHLLGRDLWFTFLFSVINSLTAAY